MNLILTSWFSTYFKWTLVFLSTNEIVKLTTAPMAAKIIVLAISSEERLGIILKNVPPAVPLRVGLLAVICNSKLTCS